jgi:hypothetical protein
MIAQALWLLSEVKRYSSLIFVHKLLKTLKKDGHEKVKKPSIMFVKK